MNAKLRIVIADDERPARRFLAGILDGFEDVEVVGEAENGGEAVELIERLRPDLAMLDLQMPPPDGLGVVKILKKTHLPLVAFVTAHDEYAVQAFEVNAIDYLLKPVERRRVRETLDRALARIEEGNWRADNASRIKAAVTQYEANAPLQPLERIPVRRREEFILLSVGQIASITADGELLNLTTVNRETFQITHRLKDLETRLDPNRFVRLGRGSLVNVECIRRVTTMPGGTYMVTLTTDQELAVSRAQSRILREGLLRL